MPIDVLPVSGEPSGDFSQQMRGQAIYADPGKHQESGVVGEKMQVLPACRAIPGNKAIPAADMSWGRGPRGTCNGGIAGKCEVLEVFPYRLGVTEIVKLGDQRIIQLLMTSSSYLLDGDWTETAKINLDGRLLDNNRFGRPPGRTPSSSRSLLWRQFDMALALEAKQEPATHHLLELSVWLRPVPCLAYHTGQSRPVFVRMSVYQIPDERYFPCGDGAASVDKNRFHA